MMKHIAAIFGAVTFGVILTADMDLAQRQQAPPAGQAGPAVKIPRAPAPGAAAVTILTRSQQALIDRYCSGCHNQDTQSGGMTLTELDVAHAEKTAELAENVIRKVRAGLMPPAGMPRPDVTTVKAFASALESAIDKAAALRPNPGERVLQRLNRVEYANSIHNLLDLDVDVAALLPPDNMGRGFDNMADAMTLSPTLMEAYVRAADKISRLAIGDPNASAAVTTYNLPRTASQMRHVDGTPFGTRGGISVIHTFPADGEYIFRMDPYDDSNGLLVGQKAEGEQIEVSINGERAALLDIDPAMTVTKGGVYVQTPPIRVKAGPQRVAAAFIQKITGPVDDLIAPIEQTLADTEQSTSYGITILPHLKSFAIRGPFNVTGVSETPSRRKIFTCRPSTPTEETACAAEIIKKLASRAYRRPASAEDLEGLLNFYRIGREKGNFESGVRTALEGVLASPNFVFRFEREPSRAAAGQRFRISDAELASRLSYFLWSTSPDDELLNLAGNDKLHEPAVLEAQVKRMLADPRSETLSTRFASQWLHLNDLDVVRPDPLMFPQFDNTLAASMKRETQLLVNSIIREDRNIMDLLTADYTFVDERLGKHYGIPNIEGNRFRSVKVENENRKGLLGHAGILTLTSIADRTSPVQRGKFVMEVLMGTPPPPPPPNVPDLEETKAAKGDKLITLRERLEEHRANATCAGCHKMMDPIGLALENFDATGRWRDLDNDTPINPAGELFDGTKIDGPISLRKALLNTSDAIIRSFTQNLMTYSLGRRVEYYDMPTVRAIARKAGQNNNRFSAFVLGLVESQAFRMRTVQETTNQQNQN